METISDLRLRIIWEMLVADPSLVNRLKVLLGIYA